jgi:tRNA threonylcarbamoyladenosine biosynthesis protein TsaB
MANPILLAIETAGEPGGVALASGGTLLASVELPGNRSHTRELLPAVDALLTSHRLLLQHVEILAFSQGPGSFTGIRIGATVARVTKLATNCNVVGVTTLAAIAYGPLAEAEPHTRVAAVLDAGQGQVFAATYERGADGDVIERTPPALLSPADWLAGATPPLTIVGPAAERFADLPGPKGIEVVKGEPGRLSAEPVAALGWRLACAGAFLAPEAIIPHYLRRPACEDVYEARRAAARARRGE